MADAYQRVKFRGVTVNRRTKAALLEAEEQLGYELTIVQGSYNKGVGASAGTHDGGGVVDLAAYEAVRKCRVLKNIGFAAWHRPYNWDGKGGGEHIHACLIGDAEMAPLAKSQCLGFLADPPRNGLGGWPFGLDYTYRPDPPVVFDYAAWTRDRLMAARVRSLARRSISLLQRARKNSDTAKERAAFTKAIKEIRNRNH